MLSDPERYQVSKFAGQRVRMAEAIVEFRDRVPRGVVRLVYQMLSFDAQERLDLGAFEHQNAALVEVFMGSVAGEPTTKGGAVVDASSRFIAKGGQWEPSPSLARQIRGAALGELKCKRL